MHKSVVGTWKVYYLNSFFWQDITYICVQRFSWPDWQTNLRLMFLRLEKRFSCKIFRRILNKRWWNAIGRNQRNEISTKIHFPHICMYVKLPFFPNFLLTSPTPYPSSSFPLPLLPSLIEILMTKIKKNFLMGIILRSFWILIFWKKSLFTYS